MPLIVGAHLSRCIILFHMYSNSRNGAAFFIAGITEQTVVYMGLTGRTPTVPLIHMCPQRCHCAHCTCAHAECLSSTPLSFFPSQCVKGARCPVSFPPGPHIRVTRRLLFPKWLWRTPPCIPLEAIVTLWQIIPYHCLNKCFLWFCLCGVFHQRIWALTEAKSLPQPLCGRGPAQY